MKSISAIVGLVCLVAGCQGLAFRSTPTVVGKYGTGFADAIKTKKDAVVESPSSDRRSLLEGVLKGSVASACAAAVIVTPVQPALASGGATAGGAYLLSAKQRYNDRVKSGVLAFLALEPLLEKGDIDGIRAYFTSEEVGSWKDFTAAGYLLANAFRSNSTAAPDTLPSVKAWKAFAAEIEKMTGALKKKDTAGALEVYKTALGSLDGYLAKVDLPSAKELSS